MALRLPSLTTIYDGLVRVSKRFPLAVVFVLAAAVAAFVRAGVAAVAAAAGRVISAAARGDQKHQKEREAILEHDR